jgi:hypothetical protein
VEPASHSITPYEGFNKVGSPLSPSVLVSEPDVWICVPKVHASAPRLTIGADKQPWKRFRDDLQACKYGLIHHFLADLGHQFSTEFQNATFHRISRADLACDHDRFTGRVQRDAMEQGMICLFGFDFLLNKQTRGDFASYAPVEHVVLVTNTVTFSRGDVLHSCSGASFSWVRST